MISHDYVDQAGYVAILAGELGVHPTFFYESAWNFVGLILVYLIITVIRNIIEPKIVGGQLGLHPVVTLASMFLGVQLMGVLGLFGFASMAWANGKL